MKIEIVKIGEMFYVQKKMGFPFFIKRWLNRLDNYWWGNWEYAQSWGAFSTAEEAEEAFKRHGSEKATSIKRLQ